MNVTRREFKYDAKNRLTHKIDELGNITRVYYDRNNRIIKQVLPEGYDSETDDGNGMCLRYNLNGQVTEVVNPMGQTITRNLYDNQGLLTQSTDGLGNTTAYTYNPAGQLLEVFTPNSRQQNTSAQKYIYDARGNITGIEDGNGNTTSHLLDDWGRIIQTTAPDGTSEKYTYDYAGNITSTTDGNGNRLVEYAYHPDNTLASKRYGNGIVTSYTYDGDRNLTGMNAVTSKGNPLALMSFSYDLNGNLLKKEEQRPGITEHMNSAARSYSNDHHTTSYAYDSLNRLTEAVYDTTRHTYAYDRAGNRIEKTIGDTIERYTCNTRNQLTQIQRGNGITSFFYDNQGNLAKEETPDGTNTFRYDAMNRQVQATTKEGNTLVCRYDAEGLRAEIEENEKLTKFIYHKGNILTELDSNDNPTVRYTRGNNLISQTLWNQIANEEETFYHHQDQQGSTIHITDSKKDIKNSYRYDAFGILLEHTENISNRLTYTGQQYDGITGQYYLRARYYNPIIGRFTQENPYRGDGLNLYAYVSNNPVSYYDPSGYSKCGTSNESGNNLPPWGYNGAPPAGWGFSGTEDTTFEKVDPKIYDSAWDKYINENYSDQLMITLLIEQPK